MARTMAADDVDCDGATGNEVNDDGDGATGDNDDDNGYVDGAMGSGATGYDYDDDGDGQRQR